MNFVPELPSIFDSAIGPMFAEPWRHRVSNDHRCDLEGRSVTTPSRCAVKPKFYQSMASVALAARPAAIEARSRAVHPDRESVEQ
jgi:hypothetical protein